MSFKRLFIRLIKAIAVLAIFSIIALIALFAVLRHDHNTSVTLPEPTGRFPVGRSTYVWTNSAATDELAPVPGSKREVVVWIWYPAAPTPTAPPAEYLPVTWRTALAHHEGILMSKYLTRDLSLVRTHSAADPPVSMERHSYPVVLMRAGGGALTTDFTSLAEDLASHGYIVVGFDAPYRTVTVVLPDRGIVERPATANPENQQGGNATRTINNLLPMWVADTKFVVDQLHQLNSDDPSGKFAGHLDLQRLGMFGHSFGGAQALQFCHDDSRCKAGIDVDGAPQGSVVRDGLSQPFMILLSDHSREMSDPLTAQIHSDIQSIYNRLPNGRFFIVIRGANHFSFSDQMLVKSRVLIRLLRFLGIARLDARRGLAITADCVHTFFDVYLSGAPSSSLTNLAAKYPEIQSCGTLNAS